MKNENEKELRDDERLTAFALGELEGAEIAEIERRLEEDPEARRIVEKMRALASHLTEELRAESAASAVGLTEEQRRRIEAHAEGSAESEAGQVLAGPWRTWKKVASVAAGISVLGGAAWLVQLALEKPRVHSTHEGRTASVLDPEEEASAGTNPSGLKEIGYAESNGDPSPEEREGLSELGYEGRAAGKPSSVVDPNAEAGQIQTPPLVSGSATIDSQGEDATTLERLSVSTKTSTQPEPTSSTKGSGDGTYAGAGDSVPAKESSREVLDELRSLGYVTGGEGDADEVVRSEARAAPTAPASGGGGRRDDGSDGLFVGHGEAERAKTRARKKSAGPGSPGPAGPGSPGPGGGYYRHDELTRRPLGRSGNEAYELPAENPFQRVAEDPRSTFSIDVDTASYANTRRFLRDGRLPPADAVRIEELVNYFTYTYAEPEGDVPFSVSVEVGDAPWAIGHRLVRIGLKGRAIQADEPKLRNLVFLLDVSGSMNNPAKLPLLKRSLRLLVDNLGENDQVTIVVYAGASGLVLPATSGMQKERILFAIENLSAGGSTNGGSGIQLAYQCARETFIRGGINRVILATDGDFNVGITDRNALIRLIEVEARSGVYLSVLGFGTGNLKDATMEQLADKGNGNYAYVDTLQEARKVLVREMGATLETIAKDVKLQLEFNPAQASSFRLIGYENRMLAHKDFNDDTKDAGEIGAGHTVTALYEVVPVGFEEENVDPLKYQETLRLAPAALSPELLTVKLRYKKPTEDTSRLIEVPVTDGGTAWHETSTDFRFAASVAAFGMVLRNSPHRGSASFDQVYRYAEGALGSDAHGYRQEFLRLVDWAIQASGPGPGHDGEPHHRR